MSMTRCAQPSQPKITIGLPSFVDFDGAVFTVQALRLYQGLDSIPHEILVVDDAPNTPAGETLKGFCGGAGVRYLANHESKGPAWAKNLVFENATGEIVLCIDGHVLLEPGVIPRLVEWFDARPESLDLLTGPLVYDDLKNISTHFDPVWRGEMWGIWATDERGRDRDAPEFEIWGNGCGLICSRKKAWLGFNENWRGFGGEEGYIHEKYRQAGRKALCLPFLRWWHRFGRPGGVPYQLTRWNKVRNYVIAFNELKLDLAPIKEHFVDSGLFPQVEWDWLVDHPMALMPPQAVIDAANGGQSVLPKEFTAEGAAARVQELYEQLKNTPEDLDQHMPKIRELAEKCEHVTDISHRRQSLIAIAAAQPEFIVSYNTQAFSAELQNLSQMVPLQLDSRTSDKIVRIDETDMLFIDSFHTAEALGRELEEFGTKARRFIVMHDTHIYGNKGEDGGMGLMAAISKFVYDHPDWFVAYHTAEQYGLTVLGRLEEDRPDPPINLWPPGHGVGTELKKMLAEHGIEPNPGCDCNGKAMMMDLWGIEKCEENFDTIVGWLKEGAPRWGWADRLKAAAAAVQTGLAFKINPLDPFPGLVREAIAQARIRHAEIMAERQARIERARQEREAREQPRALAA